MHLMIFFMMFRDDFLGFLWRLEITLKHELVHREQLKRIDLSKYNFVVNKDEKKYLSNKIEMMVQASEIVDWLEYKFYKKGAIIKFLQNPYTGLVLSLDKYLECFKNDKKIINRLYKYMYDYIVNGTIEK